MRDLAPEVELDLHEYKLSDAIWLFLKTYDECLQARMSLLVIHGYHGASGEGSMIRKWIRQILRENPSSAEVIKGENDFWNPNPGITIIRPKRPLPRLLQEEAQKPNLRAQALVKRILEYCKSPREQRKILTKFARSGQPQVMKALNELIARGSLHIIRDGGVKLYQTNTSEDVC